MEQITRGECGRVVVRVGVDLAKRVIQVHAVDAAGRLVTGRALARDRFISWCAQLPAGCVVAMEASSSAHHWARKLCSMGLDARIIAAHLVKPYRKQGSGGKNDANDAAAICEAASRPSMHFVPIKSIEQQCQVLIGQESDIRARRSSRRRSGYRRNLLPPLARHPRSVRVCNA